MRCPMCGKEHAMELKYEELKMPIGDKEFTVQIDYIECPNTGLRKMTPRLANEGQQEEAAFQLALLLGQTLSSTRRKLLVKKLGEVQ